MTEENWTVQFGILDGLVFLLPNVGPTFVVLDHEDVKGGLWVLLQLAPLIFLPLAILQTFWLDHPWWSLFSYDNLFSFGLLSLRWLKQDLLPIELDHVHVRWK
jgi:hypothetical protein